MKTITSLLTSDRGSTSVIFALASVPVLLMAGVAIDYARHTHLETSLQAAVDAAALGGALHLDNPQKAIRVATAFLNENVELAAGLTPKVEVKNGILEARVSGSAATSFMALAGIHETSLDVVARAAAGGRGMELVMVLDVSGSMSGEIPSLRAAATELLDQIYDGKQSLPNTYVGIVPFAGRVNVINYGAPWMTGKPRQSNGPTASVGTQCKVSALSASHPKLCLNHRSHPNDENDALPSAEAFTEYTTNNLVCPVNKAVGLTSNRSVIQSSVDQLCAGHGTSTEVGMVWGWRMISEKWKGQWGDPALPLSNAQTPGKYVVIMTDGKNHPNQSGDSYSEADADAQLLRQCDAMKAQGITILAVTFNMGGALKSLYGKCVSKPEYNFTAESGFELKTVFSTIGKTIGQGDVRLIN